MLNKIKVPLPYEKTFIFDRQTLVKKWSCFCWPTNQSVLFAYRQLNKSNVFACSSNVYFDISSRRFSRANEFDSFDAWLTNFFNIDTSKKAVGSHSSNSDVSPSTTSSIKDRVQDKVGGLLKIMANTPKNNKQSQQISLDIVYITADNIEDICNVGKQIIKEKQQQNDRIVYCFDVEKFLETCIKVENQLDMSKVDMLINFLANSQHRGVSLILKYPSCGNVSANCRKIINRINTSWGILLSISFFEQPTLESKQFLFGKDSANGLVGLRHVWNTGVWWSFNCEDLGDNAHTQDVRYFLNKKTCLDCINLTEDGQDEDGGRGDGDGKQTSKMYKQIFFDTNLTWAERCLKLNKTLAFSQFKHPAICFFLLFGRSSSSPGITSDHNASPNTFDDENMLVHENILQHVLRVDENNFFYSSGYKFVRFNLWYNNKWNECIVDRRVDGLTSGHYNNYELEAWPMLLLKAVVKLNVFYLGLNNKTLYDFVYTLKGDYNCDMSRVLENREGGGKKTCYRSKPSTGHIPPLELTYTVKQGDELLKIVGNEKIFNKSDNILYTELFEVNKKIIGGNPDNITPGQLLTVSGGVNTCLQNFLFSLLFKAKNHHIMFNLGKSFDYDTCFVEFTSKHKRARHDRFFVVKINASRNKFSIVDFCWFVSGGMKTYTTSETIGYLQQFIDFLILSETLTDLTRYEWYKMFYKNIEDALTGNSTTSVLADRVKPSTGVVSADQLKILELFKNFLLLYFSPLAHISNNTVRSRQRLFNDKQFYFEKQCGQHVLKNLKILIKVSSNKNRFNVVRGGYLVEFDDSNYCRVLNSNTNTLTAWSPLLNDTSLFMRIFENYNIDFNYTNLSCEKGENNDALSLLSATFLKKWDCNMFFSRKEDEDGGYEEKISCQLLFEEYLLQSIYKMLLIDKEGSVDARTQFLQDDVVDINMIFLPRNKTEHLERSSLLKTDLILSRNYSKYEMVHTGASMFIAKTLFNKNRILLLRVQMKSKIQTHRTSAPKDGGVVEFGKEQEKNSFKFVICHLPKHAQELQQYDNQRIPFDMYTRVYECELDKNNPEYFCFYPSVMLSDDADMNNTASSLIFKIFLLDNENETSINYLTGDSNNNLLYELLVQKIA